jgi:hypothetical protein
MKETRELLHLKTNLDIVKNHRQASFELLFSLMELLNVALLGFSCT